MPGAQVLGLQTGADRSLPRPRQSETLGLGTVDQDSGRVRFKQVCRLVKRYPPGMPDQLVDLWGLQSVLPHTSTNAPDLPALGAGAIPICRSPLMGSDVARRIQTLLAAGLPRMRFHDLRRGAASLLLAQGVHPPVVMEMLGHSTIALAMNIYSHVVHR